MNWTTEPTTFRSIKLRSSSEFHGPCGDVPLALKFLCHIRSMDLRRPVMVMLMGPDVSQDSSRTRKIRVNTLRSTFTVCELENGALSSLIYLFLLAWWFSSSQRVNVYQRVCFAYEHTSMALPTQHSACIVLEIRRLRRSSPLVDFHKTMKSTPVPIGSMYAIYGSTFTTNIPKC